MQRPDECNSMTELRQLIDQIDADLVAGLARRQACIDRAIQLKPAEALPARIPNRVEEVVAKVRANADRSGLDADLAEQIWRDLIEWSITREDQVLGDTTNTE
ncbi:chorismate mutase [Pseudoruegeria sp. SK021]|uniref:chorismate mutase n=1 Tax=Pseudoruegeria sp. SK021 TaxID=1933035 RepID=UPI000A22EA42|nr:chorismate mutase [Pseudoruegeria sp. SK021]OSP56529.1 chorismate mutase [Pseudoruegeria sp. SK021]